MRALLEFLRTTVIGGLLFLVPVVVISIVVGKALQLASHVAQPLARFIPLDRIGGYAVANLVAIATILLVCFLAGLAARTSLASKVAQELEARLLLSVPGYSYAKGMIECIAGTTTASAMRPALMQLDDCSQVVFEVERLDDGRVVVLVPDSANPRSGSVCVLDPARVAPLPISMLTAVKNLQLAGQGTRQFLGQSAPDARVD